MCKVKIRKGVLSDKFVDSVQNPYNPIPFNSVLLKPVEYTFRHGKFYRPVSMPRNILMLSQNLANFNENVKEPKSQIILEIQEHFMGLAQVKNPDDLPKGKPEQKTQKDDGQLSEAGTELQDTPR